jgi:heat-inducible transcriptional repressor
MLSLLNERSREIFRLLVNAYCQSGEPIGSRTVAEHMGLSLSPATIRNVMSQLEDLGLLYSPHPSAGRLPTDAGLRLFIDGLLEIGTLTPDDRQMRPHRKKSAFPSARIHGNTLSPFPLCESCACPQV